MLSLAISQAAPIAAPAPWLFVFAGILGVATAFGVGVWLLMRSRKMRSPFKCPKCGYDLRASMQAGTVTCPECGTHFD